MAGLDPAILFVPPHERVVVSHNTTTTRRPQQEDGRVKPGHYVKYEHTESHPFFADWYNTGRLAGGGGASTL